MKLTPKQIDFVNKQLEISEAVINGRPSANLIQVGARYEALRLIAQLANIRD